MNKEDREFLISLRDEMLNQETDCQANPRFWVIRQTEREYWFDGDSSELGIVILNDDSETIFEGDFGSDDMKEWFIAYIDECLDEEITNVENVVDFSFDYKDKNYYMTDEQEFADFLEEECGLNISLGYYRDIYMIKENTFFLTKLEAIKHLKENKHHYNNTAHTYAMTAWRSPQVEKLFEILEKTKWEDVK